MPAPPLRPARGPDRAAPVLGRPARGVGFARPASSAASPARPMALAPARDGGRESVDEGLRCRVAARAVEDGGERAHNPVASTGRRSGRPTDPGSYGPPGRVFGERGFRAPASRRSPTRPASPTARSTTTSRARPTSPSRCSRSGSTSASATGARPSDRSPARLPPRRPTRRATPPAASSKAANGGPCYWSSSPTRPARRTSHTRGA
jgi:hypothetical protein